jgi:copper homeostasis protein
MRPPDRFCLAHPDRCAFYSVAMGGLAGLPRPLLEVVVVQPRDVAGAAEGGADRLHVLAPGDPVALSPEPGTVSAIGRESELPMYVLLRLNDSWTTTGGELERLVGLAEDYLACGATGVAFGFLDSDLEIDVATCTALADRLPEVPWTFTHAVDHTLDPRRSWRRLLPLPRLQHVLSAGSPRGMEVGYDDLLATAESDPLVAARLMAGGGLTAEHVPWLVRQGVRAFHVGPQVRPGGSAKAYVDGGYVRSWRTLLDDAMARI